MKTKCSFVHLICRGPCRVGKGLLPERSVGVKPEEQRLLKLTHTWQLLTMTYKGRLLIDSCTNHAQ